MKILITSGATREPIDGVRFISNFSTGQTGAFIADFLHSQGHEIVYVHGLGTLLPTHPILKIPFSDFASLRNRMRHLVAEGEFDCIIHAAAVSDYSVENVTIGEKKFKVNEGRKLESFNDDQLILQMRKNPKIINELRNFADGRQPIIIAFKLTQNTLNQDAHVQRLQEYSNADYIIHNDMSEVSAKGFGRMFSIYHKFTLNKKVEGVGKLALELDSLLKQNEIIKSKRGSYDLNA